MKKRILSIILAAVMFLSIMPVSAFAANEIPTCDHSTWTAITDFSSVVAGGSYYLDDDINLSNTWTVPTGEAVNLCLNGHYVKGPGIRDNSVIAVPAGATLNLYDCDTTEHYGHIDGNGLWVADTTKKETGNVSIYGGYIIGGKGKEVDNLYANNKYGGNHYYSYGGGVYVSGTSSAESFFNMYGGNIVGNEVISDANNYVPQGGGVYVSSYSTFKMTGGTIQGNAAINPCNLEAVYSTSTAGGGVYMESEGKMIVGGNAVVKNNFSKTSYNTNLHADNVYINNLEIVNPSEKMSIGVNYGAEPDGILEDSSLRIIGTEADQKYLVADGEGLGIAYKEKEEGNGLYIHCGGFNLCNGIGFINEYPTDDMFGILQVDSETLELSMDMDYEFAGWYTERTGGTKICDGKPNHIDYGKDYYAHWTYKGEPVLTEKVLVKADSVQVGGKIVDNAYISTVLGAYGLSYNETDGVIADGTVIAVANEFSYPDYGEDYKNCGIAGVIISEENARFLLKSGSIRGSYKLDEYDNPYSEGGVRVLAGDFTMSGGCIEKNVVGDPYDISCGSVYVETGSSFTMNGGTIGNNLVFGYGAGVFVVSGGSFIMNNGTIADNIAYGDGGGVYVEAGSSFTMNSGVISENAAYLYNGCLGVGGGVCVEADGIFQAYGGKISGNTAEVAGGGVYVSYGQYGTDNSLTCLAQGTPITLADGTKTTIENLKVGDIVRVFDHETGMLSAAKLYVLERIPSEPNTAFSLHFTNGIDVTAVNSHCFFDEAENRYVSIKRENANEFIGHRFYNADEDRWETLESVTYLYAPVDAYSIETEKTLNAVANGMLSNGDALYRVLSNIFEYGDNLKIDVTKKESDIAQYGLWDFADAQYATQETYDALNLQYIKVAFGKGLITPEQFTGAGAYQTEHNTDLVRPETQPEKQSEMKSEAPTDVVQKSMKAMNMPVLTSNSSPLSTIILGGNVQITGNYMDNNIPNNVFMWEDSPLLGIGTGDYTPKAGMNVGVLLATNSEPTAGSSFAFTINGDSNSEKYFFSDVEGYYVCFDTDHLVMKVPESDNYTINVISNEKGTVTASAKEAAADTDVTLTVTPNKGYVLKSLKYNDGTENHDITETKTFSMPAANVSITAEYETHPHNLIKVVGQAATETAAGYKDYYECKDSEDACGALFEDIEGTTPIADLSAWKDIDGNGYLAPLVHSITPVNGQNPTDADAGYLAYYECQNCGKFYEDADGEVLIDDITVWKAQGGKGYLAPLHGTDENHDQMCDYCGEYISFTVTFDMNEHGTQIAEQIVEVGGKATKPEEPQEEGFIFDDWYANAACTTKFDFDATITAHTTIFAKWVEDIPDTYTITVTNDENGTASASSSLSEEGKTITLSATPNSGYAFKEWQVISGGVSIVENTFVMPANEVEIKAIFNELGDIDLVVSGDVPSSAVIDDIEEVVGMTQAETDAINIGISFETVLEINETVAETETVEKINDVLSTEEVTDTYYIDISLLLKNVATNENRPVTETKQGVTVTVRVPDEIADNSSNIGIVRYHDGVAEVIPSTYDPVTKCITFVTDKFSVYVIFGTTEPKPDEGKDYLDPLRECLRNLIANNASGDTVVWQAGDSLPYDVMQLIKNSDITLEFKYTYEGKAYDVFINKNNVPEDDVVWYGPLYLAGLPQIDSVNEDAIHGEYVIQQGDTLNKLAETFNTTVENLLELNPNITNRNLIYTGQVLRY